MKTTNIKVIKLLIKNTKNKKGKTDLNTANLCAYFRYVKLNLDSKLIIISEVERKKLSRATEIYLH